jgi:hypothetical protein
MPNAELRRGNATCVAGRCPRRHLVRPLSHTRRSFACYSCANAGLATKIAIQARPILIFRMASSGVIKIWTFVLSLACVHGHAVERPAGCLLSRKFFIIAPLLFARIA